jgi:undecaprenyl phosphate N,N'-diacetylbacillosamine 1-phosphate transferase
MYQRWGKRSLDIILAATGLIILFPLLFFITFILLISGDGSPFFLQSRPGLYGVSFKIIKFKTMRESQEQLSEQARITKIGNVLRKSSLDELPQLWNVVCGNMSLIGPRPLLTEYLPLYNGVQARRHNVKPGITGWAQINGRNAVTWEEKLAMDVWYTQNISLSLDCKILTKTVVKLINYNSGPSKETDVSEKFKG